MSWLMELVQGLPLTQILRERLAIADDRVKRTENENKELKEEVAALRREKERLQSQISSMALDLEYTEERGVLWKQKPDGTFHHQPYCPDCKLAMTRYSGWIVDGVTPRYKFRCQKCNRISDVREEEVSIIIASLG